MELARGFTIKRKMSILPSIAVPYAAPCGANKKLRGGCLKPASLTLAAVSIYIVQSMDVNVKENIHVQEYSIPEMETGI